MVSMATARRHVVKLAWCAIDVFVDSNIIETCSYKHNYKIKKHLTCLKSPYCQTALKQPNLRLNNSQMQLKVYLPWLADGVGQTDIGFGRYWASPTLDWSSLPFRTKSQARIFGFIGLNKPPGRLRWLYFSAISLQMSRWTFSSTVGFFYFFFWHATKSLSNIFCRCQLPEVKKDNSPLYF